jgi:glutamate dehydrogenase (NADP+)/cyclic pyranopterin phosphate synthase/molybdopterin-guanine dinucleotide biosynthesis protein A
MKEPDRAYNGMTPLVIFSGGDAEKSLAHLHGLLAGLEARTIKTLLVCRTDDEKMVTGLSALSSMHRCTALLLPERGEHGGAIDFPGELRDIGVRFGDGYDLIVVLSQERPGFPPTIEIPVAGQQQMRPLLCGQVGDDSAQLVQCIYHLLEKQTAAIPVWGCLLIGGRSSRMGQPKHLITDGDGHTWVEILASRLAEQTERVVLVGKGDIPKSLAHLPRLTDIAEAKGPLAGILAAMRWNPRASWVVAACDMPLLRAEGLRWLLHTRKPGVWGSVPRNPRTGRLEPLLAHYDFRGRHLFEVMLQQEKLSISAIGDHSKILTPALPVDLAVSWRNCNTPEDLVRLDSGML